MSYCVAAEEPKLPHDMVGWLASMCECEMHQTLFVAGIAWPCKAGNGEGKMSV